MPYIGRGPQKQGAFRILDDISGSFNGSTTSFALASGSNTLSINTPETLIIAVDGVIQEPGSAYTISGSNIVFGSPPAAEASFWGVELGGIGTQTVTTDATEADKDDMEDEATGAIYAPPDLLKHSPGVAKCWVNINQTSSAHTAMSSYNVYSINDIDLGKSGVVVAVDFSSNEYTVVTATTGLGRSTYERVFVNAVGLFDISNTDEGNTQGDSGGLCAVAFGDQ